PAALFRGAAQGIRRRLRHRHHPRRGRAGKRGNEFLFPRHGVALLRRRHAWRAKERRQRFPLLGDDAPGGGPRLPPLRFRTKQGGHGRFRVQEELGLRAGVAGIRILPQARHGDAGKESEQPQIRAADRDLEAVAASDREFHRPVPRARTGLASEAKWKVLTSTSTRVAWRPPYPRTSRRTTGVV